MSGADRLDVDAIRDGLTSRCIGRELLVFEQTASTNDVVARLARDGAREGVVVFAESQTKGRGRHGRAWASPHGAGLWFSVLLRPALPRPAYSRLTIGASLAVARAVRRATRVDARIKWPNDITVGGRKLAGILTESREGAAVLGIGLNVNVPADGFPAELQPLATSLLLATGTPHDRNLLAAQLLVALDQVYRRLVDDFDAVATQWSALCDTLGRHVVLTVGSRRLEGQAHALDGDGALLVRKENGQMERVTGADAVVERG